MSIYTTSFSRYNFLSNLMFIRSSNTNFKNSYVEQIIRDTNGRLVRATFYVYESHGRVKARLTNVTFLEEAVALAPITRSLFSTPTHARARETISTFFSHTISPYWSANFLYSLGSKPRAPTYTK